MPNRKGIQRFFSFDKGLICIGLKSSRKVGHLPAGADPFLTNRLLYV